MGFEFLPRRTLQARLASYIATQTDTLSGYSSKERRARLDALKPRNGETLADAATKRLQFAQFYFPEYVTFPFADFHQELMQNLQVRGRLVVNVLPRNAGKGTNAFIDNMYDIAFATESYIIRIEHDGDAAKDESFKIAQGWTTNFQLMRDFPHVKPGKTWKPGGGELRFTNGVRFQAVGLKELVRGRTELQSRISKVQINDPVKNAQEARSAVHTHDVYDLVMRSVANAGGSLQENPISYCVLGTCQARGDALDKLLKADAAKVLKIPALRGEDSVIDELLDCLSSHAADIRAYYDEIEKTRNVSSEDRVRYFQERHEIFAPFSSLESYWPERFPLPDLYFLAASDTAGFAQEMLHLTEDVKYIKFLASWFQDYDGTIPDGNVTYAMAIDPSGEPKEGTDPMAIYAGGYHNGLKRAYTKEVWCEQATPKDLFEKTYQIFWRNFPWYTPKDGSVTVYMEDIVSFSGGALAFFEAERQRRIATGGDVSYWIELPFRRIKPGSLGNKMVRILSMRPVAEQGRIFVNRLHSQQSLFVEQAVNFNGQPTHKILPPEYKVDILDAFQMWWHFASKGQAMRPFAVYGEG